MHDRPLRNLRAEGERRAWQEQYIRNALASLKHIETDDKTLAGHLLTAEQALRSAAAYLK